MFKIPAPNYTQIPNTLFDDLLPTLGLAEMKVLLVITRKTFGWHKVRDRISLSQLEELTGLERTHISKATKSLQEKNLIIKIKEGNPGQEQVFYELVIDDSNNSYQCRKDTGGGVVKTPTKETLTKEREKKILKEKPTRKLVRPAASPIKINPETKKFEGIEPEDVKRWQDTFPAVNVRKEIDEALLWALDTPRTNYRKSLNTWMSNVQKKHTTPYTPQEKPQEPTKDVYEENMNLALKAVKIYETPVMANHIQLTESSLVFQYGSVYEKIPFSEQNFRAKVFSRLKNMNLPIGVL